VVRDGSGRLFGAHASTSWCDTQGGWLGNGETNPQSKELTKGPPELVPHFRLQGSSHQRKGAACPKFDMVWLNLSPIPIPRSNDFYLFTWESESAPCDHVKKRRDILWTGPPPTTRPLYLVMRVVHVCTAKSRNCTSTLFEHFGTAPTTPSQYCMAKNNNLLPLHFSYPFYLV
jgi:hypothetical protein